MFYANTAGISKLWDKSPIKFINTLTTTPRQNKLTKNKNVFSAA